MTGFSKNLHRFIVLWIFLLWPLSGHATTWWVDSEHQAQVLSKYLETLWPEHSLKIETGTPNGSGIWYAHGQLVARDQGLDRSEAMVWDYSTMVSSVRIWFSEIVVEDAGWTPDLNPAQPVAGEPIEKQEPPAPRTRAIPILVSLGTTLRPGGINQRSGPDLLTAVEFPFTVGPINLAPALTFNLFERILITSDLAPFSYSHVGRIGAELVASWRFKVASLTIEPLIRSGYRLVSSDQLNGSEFMVISILHGWTGGGGLRLWLPRIKSALYGLYVGGSMEARAGGYRMFTAPIKTGHVEFALTGQWNVGGKK